MSDATQSDKPKFKARDGVSIKQGYPLGHCRTPWYFRGAEGVIERYCGAFPNPEELAYGRSGLPAAHLYRVRARLSELWPNHKPGTLDSVEVEVYEHWLSRRSTHSDADDNS